MPHPEAGNRMTPTAYADWIEKHMGAASGKQEAIPAELLTQEATDVEASAQQAAQREHPAEYGAQKLGNAYFQMLDLFSKSAVRPGG